MEIKRQTFLDQALKTAEREASRSEPLFALLTGSAAWGTLSARSDIDIIFVTDRPGVVSYRYYLPELTGLPIRTEVGRIPLAYLEKVLASGYADEVSTGIREQVRNARTIGGARERAEKVIAAFQALKPKKKLLGEYLYVAREALAGARKSLSAGSMVDTVLQIDTASKNVWRLLLVAKHSVGVQKDKHEIKAARTSLGEEGTREYLISRRVGDVDQESALRSLQASGRVISAVLAKAGVNPAILGAVGEE